MMTMPDLLDEQGFVLLEGCMPPALLRGLRDRIHSTSAPLSRSPASSIDRTAGEPGSPNRVGSAEPVAP